MRNIVLPAAIAATLFTTGCGGCAESATETILAKAVGASDVDVDAKSGTVTIKGKDGEVVHMVAEGDDAATLTIKGKDGEYHMNTGGAGKVPEDFPLAVHAGSKVQGSASSSNDEERTFMLSLVSEAAVDEIAAFYKKELEARGLKVERTDVATDGRKFVTLGGRSEKREASVAISSGDEGDGTFTQISVRDRK